MNNYINIYTIAFMKFRTLLWRRSANGGSTPIILLPVLRQTWFDWEWITWARDNWASWCHFWSCKLVNKYCSNMFPLTVCTERLVVHLMTSKLKRQDGLFLKKSACKTFPSNMQSQDKMSPCEYWRTKPRLQTKCACQKSCFWSVLVTKLGLFPLEHHWWLLSKPNLLFNTFYVF